MTLARSTGFNPHYIIRSRIPNELPLLVGAQNQYIDEREERGEGGTPSKVWPRPCPGPATCVRKQLRRRTELCVLKRVSTPTHPIKGEAKLKHEINPPLA